MRNGTRGRRLRSERAATLVEYALGVSLVAVVSLGSMQFLQDEGSEALNDQRTSAGAPDVNASATTGGTTGGTTSGGTTTGGTTTGGSTPIEPDASLTWQTQAQKGKKEWSLSVTVMLVDPDSGDPVPGVTVSGSWTPSAGGDSSCSTDQNGECTLTQGGMCHPNNAGTGNNQCGTAVTEASFTVTGVTGDDVTYSQTPPSTGPVPNPS